MLRYDGGEGANASETSRQYKEVILKISGWVVDPIILSNDINPISMEIWANDIHSISMEIRAENDTSKIEHLEMIKLEHDPMAHKYITLLPKNGNRVEIKHGGARFRTPFFAGENRPNDDFGMFQLR